MGLLHLVFTPIKCLTPTTNAETSCRQNAKQRESQFVFAIRKSIYSPLFITSTLMRLQQILFFFHKESFHSCCILPYWHFIRVSACYCSFCLFFLAGIYQPLQLKAVCQVSSNYVMVNNDFVRQPPIDSPRSV